MNNNVSGEPCSKKRRACTESENLNNTAIRKIRTKDIPKLFLKSSGVAASLSALKNERVPLMLTDIQHLLLHSLLGNLYVSESPRWYVLEKCKNITQTTALVVEGMSIKHWEKYQNETEFTLKTFTNFVETVTPSTYNGSLVKELALVPLSETEKESVIQKYGSMNLALEVRKDLMVMMKAVFPIGDELPECADKYSDDNFPRTQLILSAWQLVEENYPVPLKGKLKNIYSDYVMSKDEYLPVTPNSPMFGLDCEMCRTNAGSELTRVSVVNEKHETVYETLVKPYNTITDYLTQYSGITKSLLEGVTKRLENVQNDLRELLPPDAILVGQSLNIDLHALKMMHPYVIDTSLIFNFTGERSHKPKLKNLAREFLHEKIQNSKNGHCSVQDSLASLRLVQLKLSKDIEFGDAVHTKRLKYKQTIAKMVTKPQYAKSIFNHVIEKKKTSLIIGCDNITGDYHTYLTQAKESVYSQFKKVNSKKVKLSTVDSVEEVITCATTAVNEYNFVMAHLKMAADSETEAKYMQTIDQWVKTIWDSLREFSLFVVLFGGTETDNGIAMIRLKNGL